MTPVLAAVGSVISGAVLALFTIIGGVSAISPTPNAPTKSEQVVIYDAP